MEKDSERSELWEDERIRKLKEGDFVPTPGGSVADVEIPQWYDEKLFNKAKDVYKEYFASVNVSHLCGLLMSFYFTKNIKPLRFTGESETKFKLYHRYLATIRHIQKWYEGDVWNSKDPASKSLSTVRSMHARVANQMRALDDQLVYISQWDMAVTQWAFIGPLVLFRSKVGLHSCTEQQFESLIHFWRVIGYLLGMEDEYNLCNGDYDQVLAACKAMLEKEYKQKVAIADPRSVTMAKNVTQAINMINPFLRWEGTKNYLHKLLNIPCAVQMSLIDWIANLIGEFVLLYLYQFPLARAFVNFLARYSLKVADKRDLEFQRMKMYSLPSRDKEG